jgi:hypothetical protein
VERVSAAIGLDYLAPDQFERIRFPRKVHLLGAVAFGERPRLAAPDCPFAWIDIPVLDRDCVVEAWSSGQPVVREERAGVDTARNEDVLFGCIRVDAETDLNGSACRAYCSIFDAIDSIGYSHLVRVWHYFPRINAAADGLERYRCFNVGRHEAFLARGRTFEQHAPAACALGSRSGPLTIYFLAAREPGRPVANPRQWAPYRYPASYGPRGPVFSRGMVARSGGESWLFVSGTASIVGHETLHAGDAERQAGETMRNLLALVAEARASSPGSLDAAEMRAKVYVRDRRHLPAARRHFADAFGHDISAIHLEADICRADLELEVEAVYVPASRMTIALPVTASALPARTANR